MSSISRVVLAAGAANVVGEPFGCDGLQAVHFHVSVTVGAAITGSILFALTPDGQGDLSVAPVMLTAGFSGVATTTVPAGFALNGTTLQVDLTAATSGVFSFRILNPPQYIVPRWAYTSGGGSGPAIVVRAYGFNTEE